MKKLLTASVAIAMGLTFVGALAACKSGPSDADTAEKAITFVRTRYYDENGTETASSYPVIGQVKVNDKFCKIDWSVSPDASCTLENFGEYVSVGEMDEDQGTVTINVSKATVKIDYTLKASVTVGKVTESTEFTHYVPASLATEPDEKDVTISFVEFASLQGEIGENQQVWAQDGITLTNDKGESGTKVNNSTSSYHIRIYKSSSVKIEYPGMVKLIFHSEAAYDDGSKVTDYPKFLKDSLENANLGTVTASQTVVGEKTVDLVTLELANPTDILEFTASAGQIRLTSLDIIAKKDGTSDAQKVAGALAQVALDQTNYTATGSYDLPASKGGLDVSWSLEAASDYATVENGKLNVTTMPTAETEIKLVASVTSGSVTDTKTITVKLVPLGLDHAGTQADPYSIADAKKVIATLTPGSTTPTEYYVKGYVIAPGTYAGTKFNNFDDMYIADSANAATTDAGAILVYRPTAEGDYLTSEGFNKGDLVTFKGKLQNYEKDGALTPEIATGAVCVAREVAQRTDAQIVAEAKEALTLSKTTFSTAGETFELPATKSGATLSWVVTTETTNVTISGTTMTIVSLPEASATIRITATITSNSASDTKYFDLTVEPLLLAHKGTQADPFSLADVAKIGTTLANTKYYGGDTAMVVYVKGYVVKVGSWNSSYNNFTGSYLIDEYTDDATENSTGAIQLYRLGTDSTYIKAEADLVKGDLITVKGYIQVYSNKVQVTYSGSTNPTVVDMQKAGMSDADVVAAAKAAVSLASSYEAGEVSLPLSNNGATLSWSVTAGDSVVSIDNTTGKMTITAPAVQTAVTVRVDITKGTASDFKTFDFNVLASSTKGTAEDPYTVAEIDAIISGLASGATYQVGGEDKLVYVHGYIAAAGTEGQYGRQNVKIADTNNANDGIVVYGNNYDKELPQGMTLAQGDEVVVSGYLKLFGTTKEIANAATRPVIMLANPEVKLARTLALIEDTLSNILTTGDTRLPSSPVNGVTFVWTLVGEVEGVSVADGKITVTTLPAEDTPVTLQLTAKLEGADDAQKTVTVTINKDTGGAPTPFSETITFANTSARDSLSASEQVWKSNGITFTNSKASSTSNVADTSNPLRCYAHSSIKVESASVMNQIVFTCNTAAYATTLETSIGTVQGATVAKANTVITVTFATACKEFSVADLSAQVRINSITVAYVAS